MYAKLFTIAALATVVVANPSGDQCSTGPVQCCNSVQAANSQAVQGIAQKDNLIAAALSIAGATVPVGLGCSAISAAAISGNSCNAQTVCCKNNNFNGVVAIGCTPINLNL